MSELFSNFSAASQQWVGMQTRELIYAYDRLQPQAIAYFSTLMIRHHDDAMTRGRQTIESWLTVLFFSKEKITSPFGNRGFICQIKLLYPYLSVPSCKFIFEWLFFVPGYLLGAMLTDWLSTYHEPRQPVDVSSNVCTGNWRAPVSPPIYFLFPWLITDGSSSFYLRVGRWMSLGWVSAPIQPRQRPTFV